MRNTCYNIRWYDHTILNVTALQWEVRYGKAKCSEELSVLCTHDVWWILGHMIKIYEYAMCEVNQIRDADGRKIILPTIHVLITFSIPSDDTQTLCADTRWNHGFLR